jgi:hypothetical protein
MSKKTNNNHVWRIQFQFPGEETKHKDFFSGSRALQFRDEKTKAGAETLLKGISREQSDFNRAKPQPSILTAPGEFPLFPGRAEQAQEA